MRLLLVGDSPALMSGQARMVRELAYRFVADGTEVVVAGWFHTIASRFTAPYEIVHADKIKQESIEPILQAVQPDAVLVVGDAWDFTHLASLRAAGAPWRFYGFINIEYDDNPPGIERVFDAFDDYRVTSESGAEAVRRRGAKFVHLGVDTKIFRPGPRPARILGREIQDDTLVIFVNAQNRPRKNLPAAVAAIGRLLETVDHPVLGIFNCLPIDPGGINLATEIVRWDLEDSIVFNTAHRGPHLAPDDEAIAPFYEAADLYLVTSSSEGFCLPVLEAMASRALVVGPRSYTMPELLGVPSEEIRSRETEIVDRGVLYAPGCLTVAGLGAWVHLPDVEDIAQGLRTAAAHLRSPASKLTLDRAQAFAETKTWDQTYQGVAEMLAGPPKAQWPMRDAKAADGGPIDALLRWRARQRSTDRIGVVRMGGLGDMLMATRVVREAAKQYGRQVTVFCNNFGEVFQIMPEVDDIVQVRDVDQTIVVRSVADEFDLFLDLRLPSRAYGAFAPEAPPFAKRFAWMTDQGVFAYPRLGHLGRHVIQIMLESLGLPLERLTPIYEPRSELPSADVSQAIVIAPGTGQLGPLKQPSMLWWQQFVEKCGRQVVQIGSFDDALIEGVFDARGWGLPVTATLIEHAWRCVMVESGMAHLARAVRPLTDRRPTIVLFGPTPIQAYGYPGHENLTNENCPSCFWGSLWVKQQCAIGEETCINLPTVQHVLRRVGDR